MATARQSRRWSNTTSRTSCYWSACSTSSSPMSLTSPTSSYSVEMVAHGVAANTCNDEASIEPLPAATSVIAASHVADGSEGSVPMRAQQQTLAHYKRRRGWLNLALGIQSPSSNGTTLTPATKL